jgi:membrane complex biogenesis BtpA family protein
MKEFEMRAFDTLGKKKVILGMIHLKPLPGTPHHEDGMLEEALVKAVKDAIALDQGGADGCLIQTVDKVYPAGDEADYARVAAMAKIVHEVAKATGPEFQIGVHFMFNGLKPSIAVAKVCEGSYIRCTVLVGATQTAMGTVVADPYDFMTYRSRIAAQNIKLIAEVDGMHYREIGDRPVTETAMMAKYIGAHAVEVAHHNEEINNRVVREIKNAISDLPIILGGYTDHENVSRRMSEADGAFVGTCLQEGGKWGGPIDIERVKEYVGIVAAL